MRPLALLLVAVLSACGAPAWHGAGTSMGGETGVTVHRSAIVEGPRDLVSEVRFRVVALEGGPHREYALLTSVIRYDRNAPRIASAWSDGRALAYRSGDRRWSGCLFGPPCAAEEVGDIPLDAAAFARAAERGIDIDLIGARGAYTAHVPARIFREVRDRLERAAQATQSS